MQDKRLILVDGYSFFFRAYYAIKSIRKRSDGIAVNGVYGFTRMLMNLIIDLKSTHIGVVFDTGGKTFRHKKFPEYKANRPPTPDDMIPQFPLIREVCDALNIVTIEKENYEADDIIATLARKAELENYEVWIISCDKDLMQLIDENVFLYDTKENKKIMVEDVEDKWGVKPKYLLDVLALMGDVSDNVPGVPSIGPKTAAELVNKYGNVDDIIANIDKIEQEKRRKVIRENLDKLILSRDLITLDDNVNLDITIDDLIFKNFDLEKFKNFLKKMEFNSILKEIEKAFSDESGLFDDKKSNNYEYKKINDIETLKSICKSVSENNDKMFFSITTENNTGYSDIKTICFSNEHRKYIYYLCITNKEIKNNDLFEKSYANSDCLNLYMVMDAISGIFKDERIIKISYNVKKQIRLLKLYDVNIHNYDDIALMSYLLDNGIFEQNLATIVDRYLYNNVEIKVNNLEKNNVFIEQYEKGKNLDSIGIDDLFSFSCFKIEIIAKLYDLIRNRLVQNVELKKLYNNIEKPLLKILANMEFDGIRIDINELNKLSEYFSEKLKHIEKKIFDTAGQEFNINSPKQIGEILFEKMNLPNGKKSRKSGYYATDIEILENLYQMGFEIAGDILEYRHYIKLKNTYTDSLPKLIDSNNRVHTSYLNTFVVTGRLSSNNPNLQNIPIRTEDGEKIRRTFISKVGYSLIGADYSQIELRILAQYADVKHLKENFLKGLDIHTETAKKVFKVDNVTPEMRRVAKAINFSIVYGTTSFGLAKRLDTTNFEARNYIDNYFNTYPEVAVYMEKTKEFARKNGFVKTMFGRICHIDLANTKEPKKSFLERLAINAPIQGTGADIIKMAMVNVYNSLQNYDAKILLQVHDELLFEVKNEHLEEVRNIIKNTMENVVKFDMPLPVDIKTGNNWSEAH